ncbi:MAG: hypothetical protein JWQ89_3754 [Devosia sp.]|nr:hypothetical protein [Devosia sp.]
MVPAKAPTYAESFPRKREPPFAIQPSAKVARDAFAQNTQPQASTLAPDTTACRSISPTIRFSCVTMPFSSSVSIELPSGTL